MTNTYVASWLRTTLNRPGILGGVDQALISGSNFLVMIVLARQLGPNGFGAFVVAYTALIFANSIQAPLFTSPHNVLGATRTGHDYAHYTTTTALAQTAFSLAIGALIGVVGVGALSGGHQGAMLIFALAPACVSWQLQEFIRRVLYTHADYKGALLSDALAYGGQMAGVVLLSFLDRLDAVSAVLMMATTNTLAFVVGGWQVRMFLTAKLDGISVRKELRENWYFGRWLLGSTLTSWVSGQLYPLLTAGFVGAAAAGGLRAAQNLVAPTHILLKSMDAIMPSQGARVFHADGITGLDAYLRRVALPGTALMAAYCGLIAAFAGPLTIMLMGREFESYAWLVQAFAVTYLLAFFSTVGSIALRSMGKTAPMFYAYLCSSFVVLTFGVAAVYFLGLQGAVMGTIFHLIVLNAVLWYFIWRMGHGSADALSSPTNAG